MQRAAVDSLWLIYAIRFSLIIVYGIYSYFYAGKFSFMTHWYILKRFFILLLFKATHA